MISLPSLVNERGRPGIHCISISCLFSVLRFGKVQDITLLLTVGIILIRSRVFYFQGDEWNLHMTKLLTGILIFLLCLKMLKRCLPKRIRAGTNVLF